MKTISLAGNGLEYVFEALNLDIIKIQYITSIFTMYICTNIKEKLWDEVQWCKGINITFISEKKHPVTGREHTLYRRGQGSRSSVWLEESNSAQCTRWL